MVQLSMPDADQATGSWTTTPLWLDINDDLTAQPTGDGVVITSDAVGNNTNTSNADLRLSDVTDPEGNINHIIRARWNHDQAASRTLAGHCELWEGVPGTGNLRASLDIDPDVGTTETTDTYTLSGAEADAITDYADLYLRLWGRGTAGGPSRSLIVEACEFEVPDAPPSGRIMSSLAGSGGLAGQGGIAGQGGGLAA